MRGVRSYRGGTLLSTKIDSRPFWLMVQVCPTLWRMYTYYSAEERRAIKSETASYSGWAKEAVGGDEGDRHCYNCARVSPPVQSGHETPDESRLTCAARSLR